MTWYDDECGGPNTPLSCDIDSVTICPGNDPIVVVIQQTPVNAISSSVPASTSSVVLLPANPNRRGAIFFNESTGNAFLKLGPTASITSYAVRISSQTYFELLVPYVGTIDAIWSNTNGAMRITEFS